MPMAGVIENSQILILQKSILQTQAEQRSLKVTVDLLLSESKHPIQRANQVPPINSEVTKLKARLNLLEKKLATSETTSKRKMVALESRIVAGEKLSLSLGKRLDESLKLINRLKQQTPNGSTPSTTTKLKNLKTLELIPKSTCTNTSTSGISSEEVARCEVNLKKIRISVQRAGGAGKKHLEQHHSVRRGDLDAEHLHTTT